MALPAHKAMESSDDLVYFVEMQLRESFGLQAANRDCTAVFNQGMARNSEIITCR